jgi:integrase
LELPEVETVRKRIESAAKEEAKFCFMAEYLFCARISEIIGRKCPSDRSTTARGITGRDVNQAVFKIGEKKYDVIVFTVRTSKRQGTVRKIALPLEKEYEPFTEGLFDYVRQFGKTHVFPFTRQKAFEYSREIFKGLTYPVESYTVWKNGKPLPQVKEHAKPFRTHALRHLRATELIEVYDFSGVELSIYGGWTLRSMLGVGSSLSRYTHLHWRKYFPKLLQERTG